MIAHLLRRSGQRGNWSFRGTIDGLDVRAWTRPEPRDVGYGEGIEIGYGWAVYLNDCEYARSERGEHDDPDDAERAMLAAIPAAIDVWRAQHPLELAYAAWRATRASQKTPVGVSSGALREAFKSGARVTWKREASQ